MREDNLIVRPRKKRRKAKGVSANSCVRRRAEHVNHVWTYDFVKHKTADGSDYRILNIVDEFSRYSMPPLVARSIGAEAVIEHLAKLMPIYGSPGLLRSDNGPEFVAEAVQRWLASISVGTAYIQPGSPWENAYVESFNDKMRDELLNSELFFTLKEADTVIQDWIEHYNTDRPHSGVGGRTPAAARAALQGSPRSSHALGVPEGLHAQALS